MGQRLRRRDASCIRTGIRGNGEVIEETEKTGDTFRGGFGRRGGRGGGRGRGGRRGRGYGQN